MSQAGAWNTRSVSTISGMAGHPVFASQPRLPRGLCLATASQGMNGLLRKRSWSLQTGCQRAGNVRGVGLWLGLALAVVSFQEVTLLPTLLLSSSAFGRAASPCGRSRRRASGRSLAARTPLSARCPQRSWGRYGGGV